ncbi:PepSY domain-containing protein [Nitrosomonas sp.]|uniref:PepSY domain-containing protein n=1 Tax=Nitrosomonas sp. TaxID=42353 RepID=UPI0025CF9812|nr:PepSY domain-containing protein [Nitrosomonas sp.]
MFKRSFWVWLHRWAGLSIAGFLMVVSLTGSILAFYEELEQIINPYWYPVHARDTALDAATLAERVEAREPRLLVRKIELQGFDGTTARASIR